MRSINTSMLKRLIAQRDEAKLQGLHKIAERLTDQIAENPVRDDIYDDEYFYEYRELREDVEKGLWDISIRVQDFFGGAVDSVDLSCIIECAAKDIIESIRSAGNFKTGKYEQPVPGQELSYEISEDEVFELNNPIIVDEHDEETHTDNDEYDIEKESIQDRIVYE